MPFDLPTEFAPKLKPLSATSQRIYKSRLNRLAEEELGNNPAELKKNHKKVTKFLEDMGTSEKDKSMQRNYLSAIFWVMDEKYKTRKSNPYYKYYQKVLPSTNNANGETWKERSKFVVNQKKE
jgi:hypothetical protein